MKSWTCVSHGEFQSPLSICPTCKKRAKRNGLKEIIDSQTAPGVTRAIYSDLNHMMEDAMKAGHLRDYSNATGVPKVTFENEFQHESGLVTGYGKDFLHKISGGAPLATMDLDATLDRARHTPSHQPVEAVHNAPLDLAKYDNLHATVEAGGKIGSSRHIAERTNVIARDRGEYR